MKLSVIFQRLEAAMLLAAMLLAFISRQYDWTFFILVFVAIDLSMLGYLKGKLAGAVTYNIGHSLILPLAISGLSEVMRGTFLTPLSVVWLAHIAADRMLGLGLKEIEGFHHTHLSHLGRSDRGK